MLDIVDFLERVGQDAALSQASPVQLLDDPHAAGLTAAAREAIATSDMEALAALLDAQPLCGLLFPAEEEGEEEREPEPDVDEPRRESE